MEITTLPLYTDELTGSKAHQVGHLAQTLSGRLRQQNMTTEELRKAAQEFESYFLAYLLTVMRETVPTGFVENKAGEQFYSFYDQEVGRLAAQAGGIGLATALETHLREQGYADPQKVLKFEPDSADRKLQP